MKLRGCWLIGLVLIAVLFTLSSGQVRRRQSRVTASPAKPGFYIQFDMCHACAYGGWQKDAVSALGRAGVQAFVSDDISSHYTEQSYWTLKSDFVKYRIHNRLKAIEYLPGRVLGWKRTCVDRRRPTFVSYSPKPHGF
jgi:hypothetical protein